MEKTLALLRAGKGEEVRKRAKDILKKTRWDPESWFRLGMASQHEGNLEHAMECFERALQIAPDPKYYRAKASVHMESFEFEEAIEDLQKALDLSEDVESFFLLAVSFMFMDSAEAGRYMKKAMKKDRKRTRELLQDLFLRFFREDKAIPEKEKKRLWKKITS